MRTRTMAALVPAVVLAGLALVGVLDGRTKEGTPVDQPALTCQIEAAPAGGGDFALAFLLANQSDRPVIVEYAAPFLDFELRAFAAEGEVRIVQPMYDTGITPATLTVGAGETARLPTPIRLRFGPASESAADDVPTIWTLDRAPTAVRLEALLHLESVSVGPCQTQVEPAATANPAGTSQAGG